jgi:hypothetical protein
MVDTIDLEGDDRVITIPDFDFSGFYYPEILLSLLEYNRVNAPELTSEDQHEFHVQLLRAFALVGHLSNTRQDVVANELLLESAQLRESVGRLFDLIGVQLDSATPSTAELVMALSTIPASDIAIFIAQDSVFSTQPDDNGDIVDFEVLEDLSLTRGDEIGYVYADENVDDDTDGSVNSSLPTQFTSASAPFTAADVGRTLLVTNSANNNAGVFPIVNFLDTSNIEVSGAQFITETNLAWFVTEFSTNFESEANDGITPFTPFTNIEKGYFYIGHDDLIWEQLDFEMQTTAAGFRGVWEYYDPVHSTAFPNLVSEAAGQITAIVDSLFGAGENFSGINTQVRITYSLTGISEVLPVTWDETNHKVTTRGLLGQTVFDSDALNYSLSVDWVPLENVTDGTISGTDNFGQDGTITYRLPMTRSVRWTKATINGVEAYWLRFRWIETTASLTQPIFLRVRIDQGREFFPFLVTQGVSVREELVGSSNGTASQEFLLARGPLFDGTQVVEVDETGAQNWVPWTPVASFSKSRATDRHYRIRTDEDGIGTVRFGNGSKGRIPPLGTDNIRALEYRIGGDLDGNVGFDEITEDQAGIPFSAFVTNPMAASGWKVKEGGTVEDLERVKDDGPASIRAEKAIATSDIARLAKDEFTTSTGASPVARAFAVEEAFGPKTAQLIVVGTAGGFLTVEQLEELNLFFNGDQFAVPPVDGLVVTGQEITASNYTPQEIDVDVTVTGSGLTVNGLRQAIMNYINPLATDDDGNFVHQFGGLFAVVLLDCAILNAAGAGRIANIQRTTPAADTPLGPLELPVPGIITVNIVEG